MFTQNDAELIASRQPQMFEYVIRTQQGQLMDVVYAKDLFYDEDNNIAGIIGAFIDISGRKKAEESLRQSLIQAISALSAAMVHRDLSTAGHEYASATLPSPSAASWGWMNTSWKAWAWLPWCMTSARSRFRRKSSPATPPESRGIRAGQAACRSQP
jgi:hypothetical protein